MNMKYKVLALDLDGTLTNSEKKITPRTKETLIKAQQQGLKIILAHGILFLHGIKPCNINLWILAICRVLGQQVFHQLHRLVQVSATLDVCPCLRDLLALSSQARCCH